MSLLFTITFYTSQAYRDEVLPDPVILDRSATLGMLFALLVGIVVLSDMAQA